jgi:serine-type D-Ala-D-Ala carboxypeptidase
VKQFVGVAFPGCAWAMFDAERSQIAVEGRVFLDSNSDEVTADTVYDVASLTKVMATTPVIRRLVEDGHLDLTSQVGEFVPECAWPHVTVEQLLRHESGLPPYFECAPPQGREVQDQVMFATQATGTGQTLYSCLNFIALQVLAEKVTGRGLDRLFQDWVARPLGLASSGFGLGAVAAPTGASPGEVHDPACAARGGVSGNAGLYSTITDVVRFGQSVLREEPSIWTQIQPPRRGLGWDCASPGGLMEQAGWDAATIGHTGFTGCSLWLDLAKKRGCALLSNRTVLDPDAVHIHKVRSWVAELYRWTYFSVD